MRNHHDGRAFGVELLEQVHHFLAVLGVEVTGRLIREDQLRAGDDGASDGHALLLTAGELLREVVGAVADGHSLHNFRDLLLALGSADVQVAKRQFDVLIHIEFVDEVEALEHKAYVALAELGALLLLEASHLGVEQLVAAARRVVQQTQNVQQRGLAAARRAHDGDKLAVLDFKGNTIESRSLDFFRAEDFAKIANSNHNCLIFNCFIISVIPGLTGNLLFIL